MHTLWSVVVVTGHVIAVISNLLWVYIAIGLVTGRIKIVWVDKQ
jgi:hypothetical protein